MKCTTLLLLAGLSVGVAAQAAEPAKGDAQATATWAGVTVAIDPATGRLRAPTAAEPARLRAATAAQVRPAANAPAMAAPAATMPKTRAEAERTFRRHADGMLSMRTSEDMLSYATAVRREDGTLEIGHGDADGPVHPAATRVEVASE